MVERTDDDYRLVVTKIVDLYNARYPALLGYQTDLAKWMIATLSLVNAGGLAALFQTGRIPESAELCAAPAFAFGIAFALCCGLLSWTNTNIAISIYNDIINPNAIIDPTKWKMIDDTDLRPRRIVLLARMAIGSGVLSLVAAGVGGMAIWLHL